MKTLEERLHQIARIDRGVAREMRGDPLDALIAALDRAREERDEYRERLEIAEELISALRVEARAYEKEVTYLRQDLELCRQSQSLKGA